MKLKKFIVLTFLATLSLQIKAQIEPSSSYLDSLKAEMSKDYPRTITLVFHGHSVPAGFFVPPGIHSFQSYPYQLLKLIKAEYPNALVNIIVTAKGSEDSEHGAARFENDVLIHRPDVVFIDYVLNDSKIGLDRAAKATDDMVKMAIARNIKVILLTSSPNLNFAMDHVNYLQMYNDQYKEIATQNKIACAMVYDAFVKVAEKKKIQFYMAQYNHPNEKGHAVIANELMKYFTNKL